MPTNKRTWRRSAVVTAAASSLLISSIAVGLAPASAAPEPSGSGDVASSAPGKLEKTKLVGTLAKKTSGTRAVFVEFTGQGAADAAAATLSKGQSKSAAKTASVSRKNSAKKTATAVAAAAKAADGKSKVLYQVSNAVPGVALVANDAALKALAKRPDVKKISALVPKKVTNSSSAQLTKAVATWQGVNGVTGEGVKIGIIDTGIDYTHADFGGEGTPEAFEEAQAAQAGPFTPTAKVVGGTDFVGDDYNADPDAPDYQPEPNPDPNPIDCEGHGTHVSGTAAGYGVNADGSTFTGSYASITADQLNGMEIGPGMAPNASLYGLKVFGCTGSTNSVISALDWALDPNNDGDFSDHLDIVNLSLGSDYGVADDPENDVVDKLAQNGVLPVMSAGNNGDLTDTGGSPGNAVSALTVASSVDEYQLRDGLTVNAPAEVAGVAAGQFSVAYDWANEPDVTGSVVKLSAENADGCDPLSAADAAAVSGKIAWLEWDDNDSTRACGSVGRSANVAAAGATGAIFTSGLDVFGAGITGSAVIPVIQLPKAGTDKLRPALNAGTLNVTFSGDLQATIKDITPAITDTISSFTSRGNHGAPGVLKPDVAAPGDTIASAGIGTGNKVAVLSGTSMAAPATAGIAALVKKKHPTWTAEQIKAAIMNTAGNDLFTGPNKTGLKYGPARVGAGRIDASAAVGTSVLVYNTDIANAVSASFGVVEVPITSATVTKTQNLRVQNTADTAVTVNVAYQGIVSQPGVSYKVSPSVVTIKPSGSANVTVTMTVVPKSLRKTLDPTMQANQIAPGVGSQARQYVADASGRVTVTPTGKPALRVPVYGAAKPTSLTRITDAKVSGKSTLTVGGTGVNQGTGSTAFVSKSSLMEFGYASPKQPLCTATVTEDCASTATQKAGDIQYVGANATVAANGSKANGWLWFGISVYGNWATVGNSMIPYVDFDVDYDGFADYEVFVQNGAATDVLLATTVDLNTGEVVATSPVNFRYGNEDTNTFDSTTLLIPVPPKAIGVTDAKTSFPIVYIAGMYNAFSGTDFDSMDSAVVFDVAKPKVKVARALYADVAGTKIPYTAAKGQKALLFRLHYGSASRAAVLTLKG